MHRVLLGLAATAAIAAVSPAAVSPAQGQSITGSGLSANAASESVRTGLHGLFGRPPGDNFHRRFRNCDGHHCRHVRDGDGFGFGYSGYSDYGDYDANRSFDPDRWNDWWHERPERAFPRWMSRNQDCARMWYSGDVLTC